MTEERSAPTEMIKLVEDKILCRPDPFTDHESPCDSSGAEVDSNDH